MSTIDEEQLEAIAEQIGVPYTHRTGGSISPAMAEADPGSTKEGEGAEIEIHTSIVWVFAVLLVLLLAGDLFLVAREIGRLRRPA